MTDIESTLTGNNVSARIRAKSDKERAANYRARQRARLAPKFPPPLPMLPVCGAGPVVAA